MLIDKISYTYYYIYSFERDQRHLVISTNKKMLYTGFDERTPLNKINNNNNTINSIVYYL